MWLLAQEVVVIEFTRGIIPKEVLMEGLRSAPKLKAVFVLFAVGLIKLCIPVGPSHL